MYDQLSLAHRLYSIDESQLQAFQKIASSFTFDENIAPSLALRSLDNYAVVLHIWCMFKEEALSLYFLPDKVMSYSCNYFCLGLLQRDVNIQRFLAGRLKDEATVFVLSYYLAYVTLRWVYELLGEHEGGEIEIKDNMERDYFLYADNENLVEDDKHHFYQNQKLVTHLLASDQSQTDRYDNYVKQAITLTRNYLTSSYEKEKHTNL